MYGFEENEKLEGAETVSPSVETVSDNKDTESFEEMLEKSIQETQDYDEGDVIEGEIVKITDSNIFISYGAKNDAYAEIADYKEKDGSLPFKVGDMLKGYIVKKTDSETIISKSLSKAHVSDYILSDAHQRKIPVNGKVLSVIKGGFSVDVLGARAFCPMSQMDSKPISDTNNYLGNTYDFEIIDYQDHGRNVVISRRVLLSKEIEETKKKTLESIEVGSIVQGTVTRITSFGAFVDIGGVEGLIHISKISWNKVASPSEVLSLGDKVEAKVIEIKKDKVALSLKDLQEDPFTEVTSELEEGMIISGTVISNENFGSFVDIGKGVSALIPISEMAKGRRIKNASEIVNPGDHIEAQIIRLDLDSKKISLSLKSLQPDPWEFIDEDFVENQEVTGRVENLNKFGIFVSIKDGITGLLPKSKLRYAKEQITKDDIGKDVQVRIVEIDTESKRISLEPAEMIDAPEPKQSEENNRRKGGDRTNWRKYAIQKQNSLEDNPFKDL